MCGKRCLEAGRVRIKKMLCKKKICTKYLVLSTQYPVLGTWYYAFSTPQSTLSTPQSTFHNPTSTLAVNRQETDRQSPREYTFADSLASDANS